MGKINTYQKLAKAILYYSTTSWDGHGHICIGLHGDSSVDRELAPAFKKKLERLLRGKKE